MNDVEMIRQGYENFAKGDLDAIREVLAPDCVWHVPGRSSLAGDYRGPDAILGYFLALFERSGGTVKAELKECGEIAPGLVSCLVHLTADMSAGRVDQDFVQIFKREGGLTTEVWGYASDQYAIDETDGDSNVARTRRGYAMFAEGDIDGIRELFHPDITWTVGGRHALAGTYRGIDAVIGYFVALFERSNGTFKAELQECGEIAPDLVHCQVRITGDMPGGSIDTTVVQTFRELDGKTIEVHGYSEDPYAIDEAIGGAAIRLPDARTADQAAPVST